MILYDHILNPHEPSIQDLGRRMIAELERFLAEELKRDRLAASRSIAAEIMRRRDRLYSANSHVAWASRPCSTSQAPMPRKEAQPC